MIDSCRYNASPSLTHYVIVRSDLPFGFLAAQVVHAAGESSPGKLPEGTNAVVLQVPDEAALLALEQRLRRAGVAHVPIREPDAPWNGALTALGIVPVVDRAALKPMLSSLRLFGPQTKFGRSAGCVYCGQAGGTCFECEARVQGRRHVMK